MNEKAKLILHPARMQIIQTLAGDRHRTVQQMSEALSEIPKATLYRHLNKLVQGGVVEVVAQHQVRGTIEKVYRLAKEGHSLSMEEFEQSSKEEKMTTFMQFVGTLIDGFGNYVSQDEIDLVRDGVMFRQVPIYMNDEEFTGLLQEVSSAYSKVLQNQRTNDRRMRTISTIIIPEPKKGEDL
ncbi:helix-turn-helix domain-containing protein [Ectobacillus sp. sgz5001026]|uniref:helix-turn-helix domain-containing protein n=1 Tax=Ectobacillus sp. sgz5001026 TaxID=3242473 RepID=UPI0036D40D1B